MVWIIKWIIIIVLNLRNQNNILDFFDCKGLYPEKPDFMKSSKEKKKIEKIREEDEEEEDEEWLPSYKKKRPPSGNYFSFFSYSLTNPTSLCAVWEHLSIYL